MWSPVAYTYTRTPSRRQCVLIRSLSLPLHNMCMLVRARVYCRVASRSSEVQCRDRSWRSSTPCSSRSCRGYNPSGSSPCSPPLQGSWCASEHRHGTSLFLLLNLGFKSSNQLPRQARDRRENKPRKPSVFRGRSRKRCSTRIRTRLSRRAGSGWLRRSTAASTCCRLTTRCLRALARRLLTVRNACAPHASINDNRSN